MQWLETLPRICLLNPSGEAAEENLVDEWRLVMQNTGKPEMLNECVKSLLEYKKLKTMKQRLQRYNLRRNSRDVESGAGAAVQVVPPSPPPKLELKPSLSFKGDLSGKKSGSKDGDDDPPSVPTPHSHSADQDTTN